MLEPSSFERLRWESDGDMTWQFGIRRQSGTKMKKFSGYLALVGLSLVMAASTGSAALEEKIRKFLQSQKTAGRSSALAGGEGDDDVEGFWKTLSASARSSWIVAYYAENSGDMEIKDPPELRNCPTCAGRGVIEVVVSDSRGSASQGGGGRGGRGGGQEARGRGGLATLGCDTCKGIGRVRRIRYR